MKDTTAGRPRTLAVGLAAFLALSAIAGLWAIGVPAGGQPDEPAHLAKAAAVVRGQLGWLSRTDHVAEQPGGITSTDLLIRVPAAYPQLSLATACSIRPPPQPEQCVDSLSNDDALVETSDYVAAYPPLPYLLFGWPTLILPATKAIFASRLCMVALCAAFLALAFVAARRTDRSGLFTGGLVIAITPYVLFFAAAPNPNGLEMATAICLSASMIELLTQYLDDRPLPWSPVVRVALAASVLALSRPVSLAVVALIIGSITAALATRTQLHDLVRNRRLQVGAAVVGGSSVLSMAWFLYARPLDTVVGIRQPELTLSDAVSESLSRFPWRLKEMIGLFGWGDTPLPGWAAWGWIALVVALIAVALIVGSTRQRLVLGALVAFTVALPTLAEVPKAESLGFIWQGRYSLPFAVVIPVLAGWIAGRHVRLHPAVTRGLAVVTATFVAITLFVSVLMTLTRFATGSTSPSVFGFVHESSWQPHGGSAVYVVLTALAVAAYAVIVVWMVTSAIAPDASTGEPGPTDGRLA